MSTPNNTTLKPPKPSTKSRFSLNRRPSETLIRKSLFPTSSKKSLRPSINPVRKSIANTTDEKTKDFVVHYQRKIHSHLTIDSEHEKYYLRYGLPNKPKYNPAGRRFSDSSETDPDYNRNEFLKETATLNSKESPDEAESNSSVVFSGGSGSSRDSNTTSHSPGQSPFEGGRERLENGSSVQLKGKGSRYGTRTVRNVDEHNCFKIFGAFLRFLFCCKNPSHIIPSSPDPSLGSRRFADTAISTPKAARKERPQKRRSPNQFPFATPSIIVME